MAIIYQPEGVSVFEVGDFDSDILVAICVSILVTSSVPRAALAHAIALARVIELYAVKLEESGSARLTTPYNSANDTQ